jgi:predicted nucleic acid-binding protein
VKLREENCSYSPFPIVKIDVPEILKAVDLHRLHTISFWKALVVRAAQEGECTILCSEDLHHGWNIDGLRVVNPFRS